MRAVVTVTGSDRTGVIAGISGFLAKKNINIEDVSQTILGNQFAMIMMIYVPESSDFSALADECAAYGKGIGMHVRLQHADIFDAMHNI